MGIKTECITCIAEDSSGKKGCICEARHDVSFHCFRVKARNVNMSGMFGAQCGSVWKCDNDGMGINCFVEAMGPIDKEVAAGTRVTMWVSLLAGVSMMVMSLASLLSLSSMCKRKQLALLSELVVGVIRNVG